MFTSVEDETLESYILMEIKIFGFGETERMDVIRKRGILSGEVSSEFLLFNKNIMDFYVNILTLNPSPSCISIDIK